jgi:hypothetical protein
MSQQQSGKETAHIVVRLWRRLADLANGDAVEVEPWATMLEAAERLAAMERLLRQLHEWDHMDTAGDGPHWRREIERVLAANATADAEPQAAPPERSVKSETASTWESRVREIVREEMERGRKSRRPRMTPEELKRAYREAEAEGRVYHGELENDR